jgi:hypothetical protein
MEALEMRCDGPPRGMTPCEIDLGATTSPDGGEPVVEKPHFPAPSKNPPSAAPQSTPEPVATESADIPIDASHWTAQLLAPSSGEAVGGDARRFAIGLGLASLFGLATGARQGGLAFVSSAALVPAALLGACAFGLPALYIALGMVDAPLAPRRLFAAAARAMASAGLVLAGIAPVAALYVVSSGDREGAAMAAVLGLATGSLAGLRAL